MLVIEDLEDVIFRLILDCICYLTFLFKLFILEFNICIKSIYFLIEGK